MAIRSELLAVDIHKLVYIPNEFCCTQFAEYLVMPLILGKKCETVATA